MPFIWMSFFGTITLVGALYMFLKSKHLYWKNLGVPGPDPIFLIGNLPIKSGRKPPLLSVCDFIYHKYLKKSAFAGIYIFTKPWIVITDLNLAKNILVKDFNSFNDCGLFYNERNDPLTGHLFSHHNSHKLNVLRNNLSAVFTSAKMKFMYPTIVEVTTQFIGSLQNILDKKGELIEISELLSRFTTDIIGTCAFGVECDSLKKSITEFRMFGKKMRQQPTSSVYMKLMTICYPDFVKFFRMKNIRDDFRKFFMNFVASTVEYREKNNIRQEDFLDILIQLKNTGLLEDKLIGKITIEEIAAQAFLFFIAGFETSSMTMSYFLYEISIHQDVQDKLRNEINKVLAKHDGNLTYEAINEMTYFEQVLCETLRKYAPVPLLFRRTNSTYYVPKTKHKIDKGVHIIIPCQAMHHDPEIYSDPEKFDPERFTAENINSKQRTSFLAFAKGPRNSMALRFEKMQLRIALVMLLRRFYFTKSSKTTEPIKMTYSDVIGSPKGGIWLNLKRYYYKSTFFRENNNFISTLNINIDSD